MRMGSWSRGVAAVWIVGSLAAPTSVDAETIVRGPLACSRGPDKQFFTALVTAPSTQPEGATYTVRIGGLPSGDITHTGLYYVHDMATDYLLPAGAVYLPGSAHF